VELTYNTRVSCLQNPELESEVSELSANVCGSLLRLETFNLLKCSWDVEEWLAFSRADLLREVQTWIRKVSDRALN